jgi:hypothetical protein
MDFIVAHAKELTELLLAILGAFSIIAKLTPTGTDNKILEKLLSVVHLLGLTKK